MQPHIDLSDPTFAHDPYPYYQRLREEAPVYWLARGDAGEGMWLFTRYEDVAEVLKSSHLTKDPTKVFPEREDPMGVRDMLSTDPPDHTRLRGLVNRAFTQRRVKDLETRIAGIVDDLLNGVEGGEMEFMTEFALPLPITVIAELLGVPISDRDQFQTWTTDLVRGIDAVGMNPERAQRAEAASLALIGYFAQLIEGRRAAPGEDLITALIAAHDTGDSLSDGELFGVCMLLLIAGYETTVNLLGNGLHNLLRHPDQFDLLKSDPGLLDSGIEEMLRYESPVQRATARWTLDATDFGGQTIEPMQQVSAVIGAANRDPRQFSHPERFDVTRSPNQHLGFGRGIHLCLGAPLARAEARIAFDRILTRYPTLELRSDTPDWNGNTFIRGLNSLRVGWS